MKGRSRDHFPIWVRRGRCGQPRRTQVAIAIGSAAAVVALGLTACESGGGRAATPNAAATPPITVVTGLYPLAQAAEQIGGPDVHVTDVVPAGRDPRTYHPTPANKQQIRAAAVVLLVGGGLQPALEAAASINPDVVDLRRSLKISDNYPWLDPPEMHKVVDAIVSALARADPRASGAFRRNATDYIDETDSTGIDYESTLSVCPRHAIVTPDGAFSAMASTYGLADQVVATPAAVSSTAAAATSSELTTAFVEPFAETGFVTAVAAAAHLKLRTLDPLTGEPPAGWPATANYITLMEANLGALSAALGCPNQATGS
jgi:ABC-type Zn uptake system ZnuABC Zn-binding protein ZnuA